MIKKTFLKVLQMISPSRYRRMMIGIEKTNQDRRQQCFQQLQTAFSDAEHNPDELDRDAQDVVYLRRQYQNHLNQAHSNEQIKPAA